MIERKTIVETNGSKWAGQAPDPIEKLYEVLQTHTLDPRWERAGNLWCWAPAKDGEERMIHFFGNFWELSHVFSIFTNEGPVIDRLTALISTNRETAAYRQAREELAEAERKADTAERKRWGRRHVGGRY